MISVKTIGVIGAGQMGAGIAQVAAQSGFSTLLWDASTDSLNKGEQFIYKHLDRLVEKEKISSSDCAEAKSKLHIASSLSEFSSCELVIEAIIENLEIKSALFGELDGIISPTCILASNTSSISITRLASTTSRSEHCIGMHFMNPVPIMQLVEVIRGMQTNDTTYRTICDVANQMGKVTVQGIDGPGFIVNRILCPMINEAIFLLQEGVKAEDIDTAMKLGTNQPMGPLELADFVGLDTLLYILQLLHRELGEDKYRPCPLLVKYVEAGWFGRKTGRGFYSY